MGALFVTMRLLILLLLSLSACLGTGCTVIGVASTGLSIGTPKHGWFSSQSPYVKDEDIKKPPTPLNLTLSTRYILQGVDAAGDGIIEESVALFFEDNFKNQIVQFLEKNNIALINDRGLDGEIYVEASNTMENLGMRYLPYVGAIRWTERKFGKLRITFRNRTGEEVTSKIVEGDVFVQSGLFADSPNAPEKVEPFEIPRLDYTIKGESVALDKLNEQLLKRALHKIQETIDINAFFNEPGAPFLLQKNSKVNKADDADILEEIVILETTEKLPTIDSRQPKADN